MDSFTPAADPYVDAPTLAELNAGLSFDGWTELTRCNACAGSELKRFATIRRMRYDRCANCGFTFANPSPPDDVLGAYYNSGFYNNYRVLEEQVIQSRPHFSVSAYRDLRELATWVEADETAAILDFGCGPGSFLALLRDVHGYADIEGLELNQHAVGLARRCYGLELAATVSELRHSTYDVIILFETIEHLPDPDEIIETIAALLKPGGALFVTTPSVRNLPARWFPSHCAHYTAPGHVSLFTEAALQQLLARHGLTISRLETDPSGAVFGGWLAGALYTLDFSSPRSVQDTDDRLYTPTWLGRLLGLKPSRRPWILGPLADLDELLAKVWRKCSGRTYTDHLYAMATKT